jgi:hypothetical protein
MARRRTCNDSAQGGKKEQRLLIQQPFSEQNVSWKLTGQDLIQFASHRKSQKWNDQAILTAAAPVIAQLYNLPGARTPFSLFIRREKMGQKVDPLMYIT